MKNLRQLCDKHLTGSHNVEIVDVEAQPGKAEENNILATPTLVKHRPGKEERIIGDLGVAGHVFTALGMQTTMNHPAQHSGQPAYPAGGHNCVNGACS